MNRPSVPSANPSSASRSRTSPSASSCSACSRSPAASATRCSRNWCCCRRRCFRSKAWGASSTRIWTSGRRPSRSWKTGCVIACRRPSSRPRCGHSCRWSSKPCRGLPSNPCCAPSGRTKSAPLRASRSWSASSPKGSGARGAPWWPRPSPCSQWRWVGCCHRMSPCPAAVAPSGSVQGWQRGAGGARAKRVGLLQQTGRRHQRNALCSEAG